MDARKTLLFTAGMASALLISGCDAPPSDTNAYADRDTAVCVDQQHRRVQDDFCQRAQQSHSNAFLWYYLGRSSVIPYYGEPVARGSFTRTAGATYFHAPVATAVTRSVAISRGGFGSSGHGFSAGE